MTDNVKLFIESNIQDIEDEDWNQLFTRWYAYYAPVSRSIDNIQLSELFESLSIAGIDIQSRSQDTRRWIIQAKLLYIIENMFLFQLSRNVITFAEALNQLKSYLYLSLNDLKDEFENAVKQTKYRLDASNGKVMRK